jgi:hypothetical protein
MPLLFAIVAILLAILLAVPPGAEEAVLHSAGAHVGRLAVGSGLRIPVRLSVCP